MLRAKAPLGTLQRHAQPDESPKRNAYVLKTNAIVQKLSEVVILRV
jgi:hypothetical protein